MKAYEKTHGLLVKPRMFEKPAKKGTWRIGHKHGHNIVDANKKETERISQERVQSALKNKSKKGDKQ